MIEAISRLRVLVLGGAVGLLVACGGGGGGGDKGGDTGGGNGGGSSSVSTGVSSSSSSTGTNPGVGFLPPPLTGRPGEVGDLHLVATGNREPVEVRYRPEGGVAVATVSVAPEETRSLTGLPAGISPDLTLTSVPTGQHCELSVDWRFQVMPRDEEITIDCTDRFLLPASISAYPLQWVALPGTALDSVASELRVELTHDSATTDIQFAIESGSLIFMMPDLQPGTGQVKLWQGDTAIAEVPLTVVAIPALNTATFLDGWFEDQLSGIEDVLSADELTDWQLQTSAQKTQLRSQFQSLSAEDQMIVARYLWANMEAINAFLNPSVEFARGGAMHLQKASLLACTGHIIKLGSFTAAVGYVGLGTVAVGSAVTGPAAPVAAVASGLLVSAIAIKSAAKARVMVRETVAACSLYRSEPSLLDEILEGESSARRGRLQKAGATDVVITRKLDLAHQQPYQTALRVRRVLPANLISNVRTLQSILQPISGLLGERLDWLYMFDVDERLLLSSANDLNVTGEKITANTLNLDDAMSMFSVELAFVGEPLPDRPVPFVITGEANVHDSWLGEDVPVSLELKGHLTGKPPVAFNVNYSFKSRETFSFKLPVEFATSTVIVVNPEHGDLYNGVEVGEYFYFPDWDSTAPQDSFEYEARSGLGTSKGKVTLTRQDNCTYQDTDYGRQWVCKYTYDTLERMLTVSFLIKEDFIVDEGKCRETSREAKIFYYDRANASIPDHNDLSDLTARVKYLRCNDSVQEYAYLGKGKQAENDRTLEITRENNGDYYSRYYANSPGIYNGREGKFLSGRSCYSVTGYVRSDAQRSFLFQGSGTPIASIADDSYLYCPQVRPVDMVPFPVDLIVDAPTAFRYGIQLLEREGLR